MKKGLKITGTLHEQGSNCLELVGGLSVKNGTVLINRSDNYRALDVVAKGGIRVTGNVNAEGDVNAKGNGYFGPAYIGKHGKTNSSYAQFSNSNRTGTSDYALIQHSDGTTYMNTSKGKNLYFRVENKGDGNVIRKNTNYQIFQVNSHHGGLYLHGYNDKRVGLQTQKVIQVGQLLFNLE